MAKIKKTSPLLNLSSFQTFLLDDSPLSEYFKISELTDLFTAGKNGFLIEGSTHLKPSTEVKIEILDTEGTPIYVEPGNGIPEYYEGLSKLITAHVYQDTPIGIGKITILGELETYVDANGFVQPVPDDWKGIYNVKWERDIKINKNIPNDTRIRFNKKPQVIIEELNESFYSRNLITATQTTGTVRGIALTPSEGTTYSGYRGGVRYLIQNESVDFRDGGTRISINGTSLQDVEIIEYLNQRTLIIQIPYTDSNNVVSNFTAKGYTLTYQYNANPVASSILGSFGRFEINSLGTFVGDVERVKVFKKSRASNVDYEVIQDTRIDSSELLTTIVSGSNIDTGHFSASYEGGQNWNSFWTTQSNAGNILDSSKIYRGVKLQNNRLSSNLGDFIRLESGSEYTLEFYNYYETSSNNINDKLNVYLTSTLRSGSGIANYYVTQSVDILSGSNERRSANKLSYNFVPYVTDNYTLHFDSTTNTAGAYWHLGSVSLKASNELGFSPDEFTFIIPISRNLERETFDFKFEFFDINNNFVPITTTYSQTFQSGNIGLIDKNIIVDIDKQFFNFSSSLEGYPADQQISITGTKNRILGNLLITSQAFDTGGYEIPTSSNGTNPYYAAGKPYPGALHDYTEDLYSLSAALTIGNFTGSLHNHPSQSGDVVVDRITYTLTEVESVQPFIKRFTINRLVAGASGVDGTNARILSVATNTNQFIYEPTGPGLKPSGQTILFSVRKQNLVSGSLLINSSSGAPPLQLLSSDVGGVSTYQLTGSAYAYTLGEKTYYFTGSDEFSNYYSDFAKITPVLNFDGISVVLTNESSTFPAKSTGDIIQSSDLALGSGSVLMNINSASINYNSSLTANTFKIMSITASGVTATTPTSAVYGITGFPNTYDSGTLELAIRYKAGDNSTAVDFRKFVTYTKAKKAAPVLEFIVSNNNQSADAKSTGAQITSFQTSNLSVREIYNGISTIKTLSGVPTINSSSAYSVGSVSATTIALSNMANGTNSVELYITGSVTDSESTNRSVYGGISLTKVKKAVPSIILTATPQTQTVAATSESVQTGTLQTVALDALEGSTSVFNSASILSSNFTGGSIATKTLTLGTIANGVPAASASIGINYTDSEGSIASKTINVSAVKSIAGVTGASGSKGDNGTNGTNGSDGKRTATGMVYYQVTSATAPSTPSATSYTFSSAAFTSLTSNWDKGAPTFAAGNSNKYWYSTYTVVETTAGGGTGTPSFSSPTQAIGFSGLVSFTAANNVSDGSNTLSFGVAGATLINGSNISTGKIISTNYSAGTPYTADGTILDLDTGRLATKNFYVDASGNAGFRGTVYASAGTFNGTVTATDGTFNGTVNALLGNIGGWTIGSTQLASANDAVILDSANKSISVANSGGTKTIFINGKSTFSDLGGTYTYPAGGGVSTYGSAGGTTGGSPGSQTRLLQAGALATTAGRNYTAIVTETTANGTTVLSVSSQVQFLSFSYTWFLKNTTTNEEVVVFVDSTSGFNVTSVQIGGYNINGSAVITGTGDTWDLYQRINWTYGGYTSVTATAITYPSCTYSAAEQGSFTEIIDGGIQLGNLSTRYVKMQRSATTNMIVVGGAITATDNITAYASDKRLKENIIPIDNALNKVQQLNGIHYSWKPEVKELGFNPSKMNDTGLFAQEVQSVLPDAVKLAPFDDNDGTSISGENYLTVQYEKVVPLLVEAIKELKKEIEELKNNK